MKKVALIGVGGYGRLRRVRLLGMWPRGDAYYSRNSWAGRLVGSNGVAIHDSPFNNALAHYLNIALFCAGNKFAASANPVAARGILLAMRNIESFDAGMVRFELENGVLLDAMLTHCTARQYQPHLVFEGSGGYIDWQLGARWQISCDNGAATDSGSDDWPCEMYPMTLARLDDPRQFVCTPAIALAHARAVELIHRELPITRRRAGSFRIGSDGTCYAPDIDAAFVAAFEDCAVFESTIAHGLADNPASRDAR